MNLCHKIKYTQAQDQKKIERWKTDYSQGIVVMAEDDSDYFIVMECSSKNKGYKHAKVILTMGGCM